MTELREEIYGQESFRSSVAVCGAGFFFDHRRCAGAGDTGSADAASDAANPNADANANAADAKAIDSLTRAEAKARSDGYNDRYCRSDHDHRRHDYNNWRYGNDADHGYGQDLVNAGHGYGRCEHAD